jgi:hypothetical protein
VNPSNGDETVSETSKEETAARQRIHLLSQELEEAANKFLWQIEELEKLLCEVDE